MDPKERLRLLLQGDMQSKLVNTRLNPGPKETRRKDSAPSIQADQGVSANVPDRFEFDPVTPVSIPVNHQFSLSYIRTRVFGSKIEGDFYLTELDQDASSSSCSPVLKPKSNLSTDERCPDDVAGHVSDDVEPPCPPPTSFTPAVTMARFAFIYRPGHSFKKVAEQFYDGGKFWNRTWDLYFLPIPKSLDVKPFLLIPTEQAQTLLDEINSGLDISMTLTGPDKEGLVLEFNNDQLPKPEFIGQTSTAKQKDRLVAALPKPAELWGEWSNQVEPWILKEYEEMIQASLATMKIGKAAQKAAQKKARQEKRKATNNKLMQCLGRMQACFGLRPALQPNIVQPSFDNGQLGPIDILSPARFKFQDMPIFISLDTEWMEGCGLLTEVGISILDTRKLQGVVPGDFGHMWLSQIRSRHLRIYEYRHHVNMKYQEGCPNDFHHGKSEFVLDDDIARIVDFAFRHPPILSVDQEMQKRTIILVGLNLKHDILLLQRKNSEVFLGLDMSLPSPSSSIIQEVVDVAELYRIYVGATQPPGLANLLNSLQLVGRDLHNAGNDAYHTLEALVTLMLQAAGEKPGSYEPNPDGTRRPFSASKLCSSIAP